MDIEALEQREIRKKKMVVAGLFVAAFAMLLIFSYWMGAFGLGPSKKIHLNYQFAGGIDRGSPVRLAGIKVGRVTGIDFGKGDTNLQVTIEVSNEAFKQVTDDAEFYINLAGLIGERYVEVVPGKGAKVVAGATLRGVDPPRVDQLLSQGYGIFGDLRTFWTDNKGDIKQVFQSMNDLTANLNKLMSSATPGQRKKLNELLDNFASMSGELRATVTRVNRGLAYIEENGGREAWNATSGLVSKGNRIQLNDIRRLMLEDGVKVNLGSTKIPSESDEVKSK
jgi:phospholipid/cholesterol/gamma-HCH transport system substrate-binding protein